MRALTIVLLAIVGALVALSAGALAQQPLPLPAQISVTGAPQDFATGAVDPVLVYDAVSRRVLAIWQVRGLGDNTALAARVLDERGRPLGTQFALPGFGAATSRPAVAARPDAGGWIVAAAIEGAARATRIVAATVTRGGAVGPRHDVSPRAPFAGASVETPSLAFDPRSGRGVIGWYLDGRGGRGGVRARAIAITGAPTTPVLAVYRAPRGAQSIDGRLTLGFEASTRRWLAVWQQDVSFGARGFSKVYVRLVARDGAPRGAVRVLGGAAFGAPALVAGGVDSDALVLYRLDGDDGFSRLLARRVAADAKPLGPHATTIAVEQEPLVRSAPVALRTRSGFALLTTRSCEAVGHEQCPEFSAVLGQALTVRGAPAGAANVLLGDAIGRSAALVRTGPGGFLLAWQGAAASGAPFFDDTAMTTIFPKKSEIYVRSLRP